MSGRTAAKARQSKVTGNDGESLAEAFLAAKGFRRVDVHRHARAGEVDLVVEKDGLIVFVEVKTRAAGALVSGVESVTRAKQRKLVKTALLLVTAQGWEDREMRFDVIAITLGREGEPTFEHIEGAFDASVLEGQS